MEIAQGLGIAIGIVIIGGIIYAVLSNSNNDTTVNNNSSNKLKPLDELTKNQKFLNELNGSYIVNWFKNNNSSSFNNNEDIVKMLAYPTKMLLNGFGYEFNPSIDKNTNVILCFANQKTGTILKYQWISFKSMNDTLKNMFKSNEDFIIFDD